MSVSCLVLRIDRDCQRLDRVHVDGSHLFDVTSSFGFGLFDVRQTLLVEAIHEMDQPHDQNAKQHIREALVLPRGIKKNCGCRSCKFGGEGPYYCLVPWQKDQVALINT